MQPSKRLGLNWFRSQPVAAGAVWGVLQAVLFYAEFSVNSLNPVTPELVTLALPLAFLFGYLISDLDRSIRALIACQGVTWLLVIVVLDIFSTDFRELLISNHYTYSTVFGFLWIMGVGILWVFLGLIGLLLGLAVHYLRESRERQKRDRI
jgi:hypothetical protein